MHHAESQRDFVGEW
jgi:hypothetical protein